MYRLITPVVDHANSTTGLTQYFEFNQTSAHLASQSVDIALLDGVAARVLVKTKRFDLRAGSGARRSPRRRVATTTDTTDSCATAHHGRAPATAAGSCAEIAADSVAAPAIGVLPCRAT